MYYGNISAAFILFSYLCTIWPSLSSCGNTKITNSRPTRPMPEYNQNDPYVFNTDLSSSNGNVKDARNMDI